MDTREPPTLAEQLAAARDWWLEAGVDSDYADKPRNWLERPVEKPAEAPQPEVPAKPAEPSLPPLGGSPSNWPQTLSEFAPWWLASDQLDTSGSGPRVAPRGAVNAELMILVPTPEEADRDRLLSGRQGRLIANMLMAMGIAENAAYFASALPRHGSHPDWQTLAERQLGQVVVHHVNLAAPKRLLLLGRAMLPLLGHDPAQAGATPRRIEVEGCEVPTLASYGPDTLLDTPRFRAGLWRGWLEWTGGAE